MRDFDQLPGEMDGVDVRRRGGLALFDIRQRHLTECFDAE
jgi:hypothetical protein